MLEHKLYQIKIHYENKYMENFTSKKLKILR